MGGDTWEGLKRGLKKAHNYLKERYKRDPDKEICFQHDDERIIISLPREDDERLSEALQRLPQYLEEHRDEETWIVYDEDKREWHRL